MVEIDKYHPRIVAKRIVQELSSTDADTPTGISKKIGYDRRTVSRYMIMLEDLGVASCKEVNFGDRTVKVCSLNENYHELKKDKGRFDGKKED